MHLPISNDELKSLLQARKVVSEEDWKSAERNAQRRRRGMEDVLIERGLVSESYLFELIAGKLKVPYVNLRAIRIDDQVLHSLPENVAQQSKCIAFDRDRRKGFIKVACINVLDDESLVTLQNMLGETVHPYLMNEKSYRYASRLYNTDVKEELLRIINQHIQSAEKKEASSVDLPLLNIFDLLL